MFASLRKTWCRYGGNFAISIVLASAAAVAAPGLALGAPFQRGDVFITGSDGVQEYTPSGQLVQTLVGTSGAGPICFTPDGSRLVLPGVGLFDNAGSPLPSNWASVAADRCVADGSGQVYVSKVSASAGAVPYVIAKYNLSGTLQQTFNITQVEDHTLAIDLAPDECTMYYGSWSGSDSVISRFNVCTDTQESPFNGDSFVDDLRVLPNWQVVATDDPAATLFDSSGAPVQGYIPGGAVGANGDTLRTVSLDPDGTSFWVCCTAVHDTYYPANEVFRFGLSGGQQLANWPIADANISSGMAVYSPPLVGNADIARTVESNSPGTAEAFLARADYSGRLTRVHLYVDSSSTASQAVVGIYSDRFGRPGELLEKGTITNVQPGGWNYVDVPSMRVKAGQFYWVAVLGPCGGGRVAFRDQSLHGLAMVTAWHDLTGLPARWSGGRWMLSGSLSAYGS